MNTHHRPGDPHPLIFISAAETSADRHGASLIRATLAGCPSARFVGVAGPEMVKAGCERIFDMSSQATMLLATVGAAGRAVRMLSISDRHLRRDPFDAAVVIDSPMLHLPLAARAQAVGVPVLYYIAPQLWAWGAYRVRQLRDRVERVAVILPFEEAYFRRRGVPATYVGHPLAEHFADTPVDQAVVREIRSRGSPVLAILPGSRRHVVEAVLPGQLEVAQTVARAMPGAFCGISVAGPTVGPAVDRCLRRFAADSAPGHRDGVLSGSPLGPETYPVHRAELIAAADLVLVASGTSTLEVAFHQRPMIVMYNASRWFYHLIGRWMIHSPYLSLPNILAGRPIVPEFMPYYRSTRPIAERAMALLRSEPARQAMIRDLADVVRPLQDLRASRRTAALLLDMMGYPDAPPR